MEYLCRCSYCKRIGKKEDVEKHEKTCIKRPCKFKKIRILHNGGYIAVQDCIHPDNGSSICWGVGHEFCQLTKNKN